MTNDDRPPQPPVELDQHAEVALDPPESTESHWQRAHELQRDDAATIEEANTGPTGNPINPGDVAPRDDSTGAHGGRAAERRAPGTRDGS
jgi:hypothetical protein